MSAAWVAFRCEDCTRRSRLGAVRECGPCRGVAGGCGVAAEWGFIVARVPFGVAPAHAQSERQLDLLALAASRVSFRPWPRSALRPHVHVVVCTSAHFCATLSTTDLALWQREATEKLQDAVAMKCCCMRHLVA